MSLTMEFLSALFAHTELPVYLCSLANEKDDSSEPTERHIATRDTQDVEAFIGKWDRPKRGIFICVSTLKTGAHRNKDGVAEVCFLHADIDFKDIDDAPDVVLRRLRGLPLPPSLVVSSGNGYHCYWRFKEPLKINIIDGDETVERIEAALKLLADLVGGDMKVTHTAALMRVAGTHNSKNGEWKEVEIVEQNNHDYELDDVEEMLAEKSPIMLRKIRPSQNDSRFDDYLKVFASLGFKPPIDVEKRLAAMGYMYGDENGIHATQIAVSASMLEKGVELDEVVRVVLEATRAAAGDYGARWNWKWEERIIRKDCDKWLKKHPRPAPVKALPATVHNLGEARARKEATAREPKPKSQTIIDRENAHIRAGQAILKMYEDKGEPLLIVVDQLWKYQKTEGGDLWVALEGRGKHALDSEIEVCLTAFGQITTLKLVAETRGWIFRNPDIYRQAMIWDNHGKIAVRGGLIDPVSHAFEPARADHYVTARITTDYVAGAACPHFLALLDGMFSDRDDLMRARTIGLIQEILGCALIQDKSKALSRALVIHGASNTGKTDLLKVMSGLLADNPISTPLTALEGTHGLMEFTRKAPWVLHEAFSGGKWHLSDTVKLILSGDPVQINVKNGPLTTTRIRQPVFWGTNFPPQFKEATKAIVNRMVVVDSRVVFDPKQPVGVALTARVAGFTEPSDMILATERPGILNWALAGLRRALERGYLETTTEVEATLETIRADSNFVAGFLEECASFGPNAMVSVPDFCAALSVWWIEAKGEDRHPPSNESIGRQLSSFADPRIGIDTKGLRDNKRRYYAGVHLNTVGLDYWEGAHSTSLAQGKTARISSQVSEVNRQVPPSWDALAVMKKIRKAQVTQADVTASTPVTKSDREPLF